MSGPPKGRARYQWTVRYRRADWTHRQARIFQSKPPSLRLIKKLVAGDPSLSPIVEIVVERRELGPVETVWEMPSGEAPR